MDEGRQAELIDVYVRSYFFPLQKKPIFTLSFAFIDTGLIV